MSNENESSAPQTPKPQQLKGGELDAEQLDQVAGGGSLSSGGVRAPPPPPPVG
jgi:hypothetical protein